MKHKVQRERKEVAVVHLHNLSSDQLKTVVGEMSKSGLRFAKLRELFLLVIKELILRREFKIVSMGSPCRNINSLGDLCLCRSDSVLSLFISCYLYDWKTNGRFVAIPKNP